MPLEPPCARSNALWTPKGAWCWSTTDPWTQESPWATLNSPRVTVLSQGDHRLALSTTTSDSQPPRLALLSRLQDNQALKVYTPPLGLRPHAEHRCLVELTARARIQDPNAVVWRGDACLDPSQRGLKVLGAPNGCDEFVRTQLHATATKQASLLQKIPAVRDLQSALLLLLYCAVPRANSYLRMVRPRLSEEFVEAHDGAVWQCFCQLVGIAGDSEEARRVAGVSMNLGGLLFFFSRVTLLNENLHNVKSTLLKDAPVKVLNLRGGGRLPPPNWEECRHQPLERTATPKENSRQPLQQHTTEKLPTSCAKLAQPAFAEVMVLAWNVPLPTGQ